MKACTKTCHRICGPREGNNAMWDSPDPRDVDRRDRDARDARTPDMTDPRDVFTRDLDLPRGLDRERVHAHGRDYDLRGSEVRTLATIGAFRVVPLDDLRDAKGHEADLWHGDLERLRAAGLVRAVAFLDRENGTTVVTLTAHGREVLETHRSRDREPTQTFYAGAVKARELTHDAQLHRAYLRTAERLQR